MSYTKADIKDAHDKLKDYLSPKGWPEQAAAPSPSGRESLNTAPAATSPGGRESSNTAPARQVGDRGSSNTAPARQVGDRGSSNIAPARQVGDRGSSNTAPTKPVGSSDSPGQSVTPDPSNLPDSRYPESPIPDREYLESEPDFNPQYTIHDPNSYNLIERESFDTTSRYIDPPLQYDDTEPQDNTGLWIGLGVLGAGIGGLLWYAYYGKK